MLKFYGWRESCKASEILSSVRSCFWCTQCAAKACKYWKSMNPECNVVYMFFSSWGFKDGIRLQCYFLMIVNLNMMVCSMNWSQTRSPLRGWEICTSYPIIQKNLRRLGWGTIAKWAGRLGTVPLSFKSKLIARSRAVTTVPVWCLIHL